jgi:hypothetical protein
LLLVVVAEAAQLVGAVVLVDLFIILLCLLV